MCLCDFVWVKHTARKSRVTVVTRNCTIKSHESKSSYLNQLEVYEKCLAVGVCFCALHSQVQTKASSFFFFIFTWSLGRLWGYSVPGLIECVQLHTGGVLQEWNEGHRRSHDKVCYVFCYSSPPNSPMTVSHIIAPVWGLFEQTLFTDELEAKVSIVINMIIFSFWFCSNWHSYRTSTIFWLLDVVGIVNNIKSHEARGHLSSGSRVG